MSSTSNGSRVTAMMQWGLVQRRLVERREAMGLTQGEAAAGTGVTTSYVSNLENGYSTPVTVALFAALAYTYRTTVDYILGLTDNPAPGAGATLPPRWEEMVRIMEHG